MFTHYITSINYERLIEMQANQETFQPMAQSRKQMLKINNRKVNFQNNKKLGVNKVKKIGKQKGPKRK